MSLVWSPQQEQALQHIGRWLRGGPQVFRLFGYAGTGKTTLAIEVANQFGGRVKFCAFTGKAALVMQQKGCVGASTIHSLIYKPYETATEEIGFELNPDSDIRSAELVIVDECSMVGEELANDLLSFSIPVLVLGDPAQLPPVKDAGYFTDAEPDFMLTEIHRQARDNPIIALATEVREGRRLRETLLSSPQGDVSRVLPRSALGRERVKSADQLIVGLNRTRRGSNDKLRTMHGFGGPIPCVGETLICLKNNREKGLLNGGMWIVADKPEPHPLWVTMNLRGKDEPDRLVEVRVPNEFFSGQEVRLTPAERRKFDEFDYGYAITAHKSQGSQWNDVVIIDESFAFKEFADRWLYTAITLAARSVTVARPDGAT